MWLQRDFGIYVINMFDTYFAMKSLNYAKFSLQYLVEHFCQVKLDKTSAMSDWRARFVQNKY